MNPSPSLSRLRPRLYGLLALSVLQTVVAPSASAWGPPGHRAVGRVAEHHLTPEAARLVVELLAPEELAYVTTWADEIRAESAWVKAEPWHWVTIPDAQSYDAAPKNPEGDILEAIPRFEKVIGD